jgi:hypothetical protein
MHLVTSRDLDGREKCYCTCNALYARAAAEGGGAQLQRVSSS